VKTVKSEDRGLVDGTHFTVKLISLCCLAVDQCVLSLVINTFRSSATTKSEAAAITGTNRIPETFLS
jgi:hypothetical protein